MHKIRVTLASLILVIVLTLFTNPSPISAQGLRGNPQAPVTIVVFSDFQCPTCALTKKVIEQVLKKYNGKVNLVIRHLPLKKHSLALPAAQIFEALYQQDEAKAWKFYDLIMSQQSILETGDAGLQSLVDQLNLTVAERGKLQRTLADPAVINSRITTDIDDSKILGLHKVPSLFINGTPLESYHSPNDFFPIIDDLLLSLASTSQVAKP